LFFSCISVSSFNNYTNYTKEKLDRPVNYKIVVRSAIVEDDYVENKDIENQVSKNLETMYFESQKNINAKNKNRDILVEQLFLDIVITQRTFIKNIDTCNSIFLNARLVDSNGTIVLQNCLNRETKNTIVSSYEQNRLCKYIFMKTNHFVLDNLKS
jgi:hypothetical protein